MQEAIAVTLGIVIPGVDRSGRSRLLSVRQTFFLIENI
jgi:hypothetical protein